MRILFCGLNYAWRDESSAPFDEVFYLIGHYLREPLPAASLLAKFAGCVCHVHFSKSRLIRHCKMADEYFFGEIILLCTHFLCSKVYFQEKLYKTVFYF